MEGVVAIEGFCHGFITNAENFRIENSDKADDDSADGGQEEVRDFPVLCEFTHSDRHSFDRLQKTGCDKAAENAEQGGERDVDRIVDCAIVRQCESRKVAEMNARDNRRRDAGRRDGPEDG